MMEKFCDNCGARMIYNRFFERWKCNQCGNVIVSHPKPYDKSNSYIN